MCVHAQSVTHKSTFWSSLDSVSITHTPTLSVLIIRGEANLEQWCELTRCFCTYKLLKIPEIHSCMSTVYRYFEQGSFSCLSLCHRCVNRGKDASLVGSFEVCDLQAKVQLDLYILSFPRNSEREGFGSRNLAVYSKRVKMCFRLWTLPAD